LFFRNKCIERRYAAFHWGEGERNGRKRHIPDVAFRRRKKKEPISSAVEATQRADWKGQTENDRAETVEANTESHAVKVKRKKTEQNLSSAAAPAPHQAATGPLGSRPPQRTVRSMVKAEGGK
jgi:hypothetical protein